MIYKKKIIIIVCGIWYIIYLLLRLLDFKNFLLDGIIEYFDYYLYFKRVSKVYIIFNIFGYLFVGIIIVLRLLMV